MKNRVLGVAALCFCTVVAWISKLLGYPLGDWRHDDI